MTASIMFLKGNLEAIQKFYESQEKIIDLIGIQSPDPRSAELVSSILESNERVLREFYKTNEIVLQQEQSRNGLVSPAVSPTLAPVYEVRSESTTPLPPVSQPTFPSEIQSASPSASQLGKHLQVMIANLLGVEVNWVGVDADFEADLGLDSLRLLELWGKVVDQFPAYKSMVSSLYSAKTISELVAQLSPEEKTTSAEEAASLATEAWLIRELAEKIGVPVTSIHPASYLQEDLGMDSLRLLELQGAISSQYPGTNLHLRHFYEVQTVRDLALLLSRSQQIQQPTQVLHPFTQHLLPLLEAAATTSVSLDERYYASGKLNAFAIEKALYETFKMFPHLAYLERTLLNCQCVDEINTLLQQAPAPLLAEETPGEETVQRIIWQVGKNKISIPSSPLSTKILLLGQKENVTKWAAFFQGTSQLEAVMLENKKWYYQKEAYVPEQSESMEQLLQVLDLKSFGLLVFLGHRPQKDKVKMLHSGLQLLHLAKFLSKADLSGDDNLNVSVLLEDKGWITQIAARGVAKALSKEWKGRRVRTFRFQDHFSQWQPDELLQVLQNAPASHDLIIKDGSVYTSSFIPAEIVSNPTRYYGLPTDITTNGVILLLGGASGITAEMTKALSQKYRCQLVCLGRTPKPPKEPFPGWSSEALTSKDILTQADQADLSPAKLQKNLLRIKRQKTIFATQRIVEANQAKFHYVSGDASKRRDIRRVLKYCRELGPIVGVIHGSGYSRDAKVERKSKEEFKAIFNTKALAAWHLYNELKKEPELKFVFFMSSLASVYGNEGQADYIAANDFLNELAYRWNQEVAYKVKSLIWGVWSETGFVKENPASFKMISDFGLQGIKNEMGVDALFKELEYADKEESAILLTTPSCYNYVKAPHSTVLFAD